MVVVVMDLWHYRSIVSGVTELLDFSDWLLQEKDFDVEGIGNNITEDELEGADILMILSPGYQFEEEEISSILKFVRQGGSLLISRPATKIEYLNRLIEKMGARFTGLQADSWAFYADIPDELLQKEEYRRLKQILSEHWVNKGLKAVAEGTPKEKQRPYILEVFSGGWNVIGAANHKGKAYPTAVLKTFETGRVVIIGALYIFYKWKFWYDNRDKEGPESYITNYTYMDRIMDYLAKKK